MVLSQTRTETMLHWIFFTVAGAFLVGSLLRNLTGGKEAKSARHEDDTPRDGTE